MSKAGTYRLGRLVLFTVLFEAVLWGSIGLGWWLIHLEPRFVFERPEAFRILPVSLLLPLVLLLHTGWRMRALARFADDRMQGRMVPGISTGRVFAQYACFRTGVVLAIVALAGPQFGTRLEETTAEGIDVVVAVDVSNSMECTDVKPDRMEVARRTMNRLADNLHGDRLGIVVFAGEAFVQLPITTDRSAAKLFISTVNTSTVGRQGTAIGAAIELAQRSFDPTSEAGKAIVVITDGENHEDDALGAARVAQEAGIVVHTVGMGTTQGGPIPLRRNGQVTGFRKDRNGNTVISKLDEAMLVGIAEAGGGIYHGLADGSGDVGGLMDELRKLDGSVSGTFRYTAHEDRYQYPLALAIMLFLWAMLLGDRKGSGLLERPAQALKRALPALIALVLAGCGDGGRHAQERAMREGITHYGNGDHAEAAAAFTQAGDFPWASYDLGHAYYRLAALDSAVAAFTKATASTVGPDELASVWYNLGNARLEQARLADSTGQVLAEQIKGIKTQDADLQAKLKLTLLRDSLRRERRRTEQLTDSALAQGVAAYSQSLRLQHRDEEARYNLAVALRRQAARKKAADDANDKPKDEDKQLSERARMLLEQAEALTDEYRFQDALDLLRNALQQEPTLSQRKDFMDKLELITKAANAS